MLAKRPIKNVHIYVLKDPETGEVRYVGKTKRSLRVRLDGHLLSKSNDYRSRWIESLKNKNLSPTIESIELVSDETWAERETFWIRHYKKLGAKLTNGNEGGMGCHNPSDETRAKISFASKNRSQESRQKISDAHKGRKRDDETRTKISNARTGMKFSEEHKTKMSVASKNMSAEHRKKISNAGKGRICSTETRKKLSAAKQNMSAETRAKIGLASTGRKPSAETTAKRLATLKLNREKKNKIPFNQRKSLTSQVY